ncbi:hypothetical protein K7I13_06415 [Brucepastera parasyntrophica]|uniref:hypothetical protein n=1 Tax=Brucepastera parasyntrophica TaxID=2880008 RepID=UPI00210DD5D7|nr:hypothetical protein [Brucepastera parasyntrophica]ULQ60892.1 hypothetical protein K7I13_06415 [Brucepastera parasyntrophica]
MYIRGISWKKSGGQDVAYFRGFEFARFDNTDTLQYQILVPYAKMFPFLSGGYTRPEIMMRAVDRNSPGKDSVPQVIYGKIPELEKNILLLDMAYEDFSLLVASNKGPESMNLLSLFRFFDKAETYSYSGGVYLQEIIRRLSDPFLILVISIFALVTGWKYRFSKNIPFKAGWVFCLPIFPLISFWVIEAARYVNRMLIVIVSSLVPDYALVLSLVCYALLFLAVSIYFFFQRGD